MSSNCDSRDLPIRQQRQLPDAFRCRLCKGYHALRKCQTFLNMDVEKRFRTVLLFDYCPNCLAHEHSEDTCIQNTGCHICSKRHHTLLHDRESTRTIRSREANTSARGIRKRENTPNRRNHISSATLNQSSSSSILSSHRVSLLPTATVVLISKENREQIRALIDVCAQQSRILQQLVDTHKLTTYNLNNETYAILNLSSRVDRQTRIIVDAKIVARLPMKTPTSSVNPSIVSKFSHLLLADKEFHISQGISLVLGNDACCKIFKMGVIPGEYGLPLAQDTVFGWVLSGPCTH